MPEPDATRPEKHFAYGTTNGPNYHNLQTFFWKQAVAGFRELLRKYRQYAVPEAEYGSEVYTEDDFVPEAAGVLILAGTSVAQLAGHNSQPDRAGRTPHLAPALEQWFGKPLPAPIREFIDLYDSIRHFGEAKYDAISSIDPELLTTQLTTAQEIWRTILSAQGMPLTEYRVDDLPSDPEIRFDHDFSFRD